MPRVSVIIPAYNAAPHLAEAVNSVLTQTYRDFEVLVVDDGSTDNTTAIAESFGSQVKLLAKAQGGPASARNLAIRQASGEYLAFLDSDDVWMRDKLAQQVAQLDTKPEIALSYGKALMFSVREGRQEIARTIGYTEAPSFKLLLFGNFIPNSTVMIRRSCQEVVGWFNEIPALIGGEDFEYWLRVAMTHKLAGLACPLAYYRVHDGNLLGAGQDIEKGLRLALMALTEMEKNYPSVWAENEVNRDLLFARLYIRAGHNWKQRGAWLECLCSYQKALSQSARPKVFRWLVAATLLKQWS